ncbi:hypothetical protein [Streptomyces coeruleorubidus]
MHTVIVVPPACVGPDAGKKGSLVSLATPFDLVPEDDLVVLTAARSEVAA